MRIGIRAAASALTLATLTTLAVSAQPASAAGGPQVTVLAGHLNNPRQLTFANGSIYVAEAGRGGGNCPASMGGARAT